MRLTSPVNVNSSFFPLINVGHAPQVFGQILSSPTASELNSTVDVLRALARPREV